MKAILRFSFSLGERWVKTTRRPICKSNCKIGYFLLCQRNQSYEFGNSRLPFLTSKLGDLVHKAANEAGDETAIIDCTENKRKTYAEFYKEVNDLAAGLISLGVKKGERLGIWGPNSYEWLLTLFATAKIGLVMVCINPAYQAKELEYALNKVSCSTLIAASHFKTQDYYELLCQVSPDLRNSKSDLHLNLSRLPHLKKIVLISDATKQGTMSFIEVMNAADSFHYAEIEKVAKCVQFDDAVNIQYTSGTTGNPKGATLSHFNIVNNAYFTGNRLGYHKMKPVICLPVPLYHCFSSVVGAINAIIFQGTIVLSSPSFQPLPTLKAVNSERCNVVYGTPTMYTDMINHPDLKKFDLSSLKLGLMSGTLCPVQLIQDVKKIMGIQDILIPYGTTEASPVATLTMQSDLEEKKLHSVGKPLDYVEVKLVDDEGRITASNERGEVCLRGHLTFLGYWDDVAKTEEVLKADKWYYTGDIGVMDEDGYLFIVGRKKDMIIRGGENIYPREIEEFILTHPSVAEVYVVGVPDKRMGEEVCAWIRLVVGENLTAKEVKDFCHNKISHFKIPRYILFVSDHPKTVTGKVKKFQMKEDSIKLLNLQV